MTTFDDRERAFENKFALDEELRFKATARRNKLLGLWAAERLGRSGAEADAYAKSVVMADFEEAGEEDVLRKVRADGLPTRVVVATAMGQSPRLRAVAALGPDALLHKPFDVHDLCRACQAPP